MEHDMVIRRATTVLSILLATAYALPAQAQQHCHREAADVTCEDGHSGVWSGDSIFWVDVSRSRSSPHPCVFIGHKDSVRVGPGVFVGHCNGMMPLDDPS